jgi:hypothetical protein
VFCISLLLSLPPPPQGGAPAAKPAVKKTVAKAEKKGLTVGDILIKVRGAHISMLLRICKGGPHCLPLHFDALNAAPKTLHSPNLAIFKNRSSSCCCP